MLKSLELFGFKSFADRTRFDFSTGITAVVGPNGSGKSNVVDGLKWILGDQSPKSLRGKEMTDVIFNGVRNRKAAAMAEATLAFDNASDFLPVESTEVQVGRRLWRNGDSEYLLNGTPVRLKDIRALLMGSNAGSAAYSIIEQGRVDQILQANAISRRGIFEEAAGISLYKTRRADFVRRMERVDQMLARLTDMVDEVDAQRTALRSQAEKAAKYREISEELKTAWIDLAVDDYNWQSSLMESATAGLVDNRERLDELNERRSRVEAQLERIDHEIAEVDRRLREKDREISGLREQIAGHLTSIRLETERCVESRNESLRLKRRRFLLAESVREGEEELRHLEGVLDDCARRCDEFHSAIAELDSAAAELRHKLEGHRQHDARLKSDLDDHQNGLAALNERAVNLRANRQSAESARAAANAKRELVEDKLTECRREAGDAERRLQEVAGQFRSAEQRQSKVAERRDGLLRELTAHQSTLADLRERRSGCEARISVLQDLESRQEGLGIGVKEILRRAQTSEYPPWNDIAGTVADLIDVDLEHAALLEAALGSRAQLIVIRDFGPLREYLEVHATQISGRVGFLEVSGCQGVAEFARVQTFGDQPANGLNTCEFSCDANGTHLTGKPGVVRRADELAKGVDDFETLPALVLADTWVVETLDDAFALAADAGAGCRFVTLQGEVLEPDGTLIVGTLRNETAVVSRKSELRQLKNELLRIDDKVAGEERSLADANASLAEIDEELAAANANLDRQKTDHAERLSEHAAQQREVERLQSELQTVDDEIAARETELARLSEELDENQTAARKLEGQVGELRKSREDVLHSIEELERQIEAQRQQRDQRQLELAKQNERRDALQQSRERAQRDLDARRRQRGETAQRYIEAQELWRDVELTILNHRAELAELAVRTEAGLWDSEAVLAEKDDIRSRRAALAREDAELRKEATRLQETVHRAEMEIRESGQRRQTLEERIREEYQVELSEIVDDTSVRSDESPEDDVPYEEAREEREANVERLRRKLKALGSVNTDSLRDLDEIEARYEHLSATLEDLVEAKKHLEGLVRRIDQKCREMFRDTFDVIRENFQQLFRKAFGGGDGDIVLEDPEDVLECGIDIVARPPGKELKSITLLSGGEKTLTAFALLLALFRYRPSPYCILDEVDAALDEANVERLLALLQEFKRDTQFVIITHKKPTMTIADTLYGVTMEESGVSKRMTVKFENIGEDGEFVPDDAVDSAA